MLKGRCSRRLLFHRMHFRIRQADGGENEAEVDRQSEGYELSQGDKGLPKSTVRLVVCKGGNKEGKP